MADELHDNDAELIVETLERRSPGQDTLHFDAVVVGTGFAGAVTACRLVEAGFSVCVFERGRRYGKDDFPRFPTEELFDTTSGNGESFAPPPDFSRWLWTQGSAAFTTSAISAARSPCRRPDMEAARSSTPTSICGLHMRCSTAVGRRNIGAKSSVRTSISPRHAEGEADPEPAGQDAAAPARG